MNIDETAGCGWGGWGDNVYGKSTPPIFAGEFDAGNRTKHELLPSLDSILLPLLQFQVGGGKTHARQQRHVRKVYTLERRLVLGVRHQEGFANFRIAQDRVTDIGRDFLEKDNVRTFGFLEETIEE